MFDSENNPSETGQQENPSADSGTRILLADDGSKHARAAANLIKDLPLPPGSTVHVLAVVPTVDISVHTQLEEALERTESLLKESGIQVTTEMKGGVPAATINDYAGHINPDLIVMGAKGLRATLGILLGGVAQQVVEYSCCPVLVVRAPYKGIHRVLILTDGSEHSHCAIKYIGDSGKSNSDSETACRARFPLPPDADVHVMHVLNPLITADLIARSWTVGPDLLYPLPTDNIDESGQKEKEEIAGQKLLDDAVKTLEEAGITASSVLTRGDAASEIIEYIKAHEIDFIVCGSRGLSQVSSWLLGSVSRKLVHYSDCTVLIVKRGDPKPTVG